MQAMLGGSAGYASWLFRLGWLAGWLCSLAFLTFTDGYAGWLYLLCSMSGYAGCSAWLPMLIMVSDYDVCLNILDQLAGWL